MNTTFTADVSFPVSAENVARRVRRSIREVSTAWRLVLKIRYRSFLVFLLGLYTGASGADDRPSGIPDGARWVKVDRVTDGDTIVLMDRRRIRLHGIDAPEQDQPYGSVATAALKYMVGRTKYGLTAREIRTF